ncbi:peptidylprolyl isomerase [Vibrio tubiashii]|uniref:peptidylprolyl isomerase n=1 Tax=Vibrio tubiashii TaxID=29498 RepID=UPI00349EFEA2
MLKTSICALVLAALSVGYCYADDRLKLAEGPGGAVTTDDLKNYIEARVPPERQGVVVKKATVIKSMIENLYSIRALHKEAKDSNLINEKYVEWAARYAYQRTYMEAYLSALVDEKMTGVDLKAAAREYFIVNKKDYIQEEKVRAAHILIKTGERDKGEALSIINDIKRRVDSGEDFLSLAEKFSEDKSVARNKGDLGYFSKGQMVKSFEDAAFALTMDAPLSGVIESKFGYHLIKLLGRVESGYKNFEEVGGSIVSALEVEKRKEILEEITSVYRIEADKALNEKAFEELMKSFSETGVSQ